MSRACLVFLAAVAGCAFAGFPYMKPTTGAVWPQPQMSQSADTFMIVRPHTFNFSTVGKDCDILQAALKRYMAIMFTSYSHPETTDLPWRKDGLFRGYLDTVKINLLTACEKGPHRDMDEHYELKIDSPDAPYEGSLIAQSVWGILRGLETLSQVLVASGSAFQVNSTQIMDFPRFSYRGLMLDTARHYLPVSKIQETLDLMAMNKFNVFHWHLVDDQSFPYESQQFPNLSKLGAYSSRHVYSPDDVAGVVEYARLRGIRVIPEFDTPGHTQSWGPGQPGFLTPCYKNSTPDGTFGPVDPTRDANYDFLRSFFTEVTQRFPDHYVHLGGDEVDFSCWESNPSITQFMANNNITGNYSKLEEIYVTKLVDIIANLPTKNGYLVWQEVFDNGVQVAKDTVIHVWKNENSPTLWKVEMEKVTDAGYEAVLSSCWYLNYISYGIDWHKYYQCDPQDFNGTASQQHLVLGGEACVWGEYVDRTNVISRTWPRASVVAEKLWSSAAHTTDPDAASPRLEEHRCRLLGRGFGVEPIWPSFCEADLA